MIHQTLYFTDDPTIVDFSIRLKPERLVIKQQKDKVVWSPAQVKEVLPYLISFAKGGAMEIEEIETNLRQAIPYHIPATDTIGSLKIELDEDGDIIVDQGLDTRVYLSKEQAKLLIDYLQRLIDGRSFSN